MFKMKKTTLTTRAVFAAIVLFALPLWAQDMDSLFISSHKGNLKLPGRYSPDYHIDQPLNAQADSSSVAQKQQRLSMSGQYAPKYFVVAPFAIRGDASNSQPREYLLKHLAGLVDIEAENWGGARRISVSSEAMVSLERTLSSYSYFSTFTVTRELDKSVVPAFVDAISGISNPAAEELLDEQQKHSFITDKAKQSAVTTSEIGVVQNCGYIFIPWINNYSEKKTDKGYWCYMGVGLLIYSVKNIDGRWQTTLEATPYDKSFIGAEVSTYDGAFDAVAQRLVKGCFTLLAPRFRKFNVTSQVLEPGFNSITFSLPTTQQHWLLVDTRVRFIKLETGNDGSVQRKDDGWGLVIKQTGEMSDNDPKYKAQVIAGSPSTGTIVEEIKSKRGDMQLGWSVMPFELHTKHDKLSGDSTVPSVAIDNLSSSRTTLQMPQLLSFEFPMGKNNPQLRQIFINLDLSLMWFPQNIESGAIVEQKTPKSAPDTLFSEGNAFWMSLGLGMSKRMYFRRLAIKPFFNARFGALDYSFASQKSNDSLSVIFGVPMLSAGSDVEIALAPDASIGVSFWYCRAFPFIWSLIFSDRKDPVYPNSQTKEFAPVIEGLGYNFHLTIIF